MTAAAGRHRNAPLEQTCWMGQVDDEPEETTGMWRSEGVFCGGGGLRSRLAAGTCAGALIWSQQRRLQRVAPRVCTRSCPWRGARGEENGRL